MTRLLILSSGLLMFISCSSSPIQSVSDKDAPIAKYRTYRWITQTEANQLQLQNPHIDYMSGSARIVRRPDLEKKVRAEVEADLAREGFQALPDGRPDFYVTFYGKAKDQNWVSSWEGLTPEVRDVPVVIFPGFDREQARSYVEGTIYLTFYDSKTKQPAWTGSVNSTRFGPNFGEPEVVEALSQIVSEFGKTS